MHLKLPLLSKLLKLEITTIGDIRLMWLNDTYVITENPMTLVGEIDCMDTYEYSSLSVNEFNVIQTFKSSKALVAGSSKINIANMYVALRFQFINLLIENESHKQLTICRIFRPIGKGAR